MDDFPYLSVCSSKSGMRSAILGNVGTLVVFRVGAVDAQKLVKELHPELEFYELTLLPNRMFWIRRHLFAALPSSMKSAVWAHHLLRATTHPEFTAEQRSVIYDAIRLLS